MIGLGGVIYTLLSSKPTEVAKVTTKTNTTDRNIIKTKTQQIDRTIVKKDVDGSVTTTTEHINTDNTFVDKTKSKSSFTSTEKTSYLSRYSLGVNYPFGITTSTFQPNFNYRKLNVEGGVRLFNSPVFVTLGTNLEFNTINVGFRIEF